MLLPLSWIILLLSQPWPNFQDPHNQNWWCGCIIFHYKTIITSNSFFWFIETQYRSISCVEISRWLFFRLKIERSTTDMAFFWKNKSKFHLSKNEYSSIYVGWSLSKFQYQHMGVFYKVNETTLVSPNTSKVVMFK